ncbi:isocitrate lyase/PEP mutase family protein [Evansella sp. LMS18]|uniref:isocitrate lyase/PEP mutase family protein n=1 Tax=Evansella sp. LMS18 TaxID=2924033 RepID=UPI0020D069A5|nr:isocitrate lyase/PEP mutase family protein [Evansella sp. LMS18]UTR12050.1 isocitrate lyase/PEP mutase family protein [Evansella sp. LMS18]
MNVRERLVKQLSDGEFITAPGAYDALGAKMIEETGFPAVYMTGAGVSYSSLGKPDLGLLTLTEMAQRAAYMSEAINIPIIADADTGFGNPLNVIRTVREYERAGVSVIQIEDQDFPKKCGHMKNKKLVPTEDMVQKIYAAVDARTDADFLIMARTDARGVEGLEEALERGERYKEAGADIVFIEAPQSVEELREIPARLKDVYLIANMVEGGKTPIIDAHTLHEFGFSLSIYPNALTRFIVPQVMKLLKNLKEKGTTSDFHSEMYMFNELNELVGLSYFESIQEKYKTTL